MNRSAATGARYYGALVPIVVSAASRVAADRTLAAIVGPSQPRARRWFRTWCIAACRRLGIAVEIVGRAHAAPCIYVSNHRSYLDIVVLGGAFGASFLSRADVASWRVIGDAARAIGTVFIDRDDPRSRMGAARALARGVRSGSIIVFPEGTTGGERLPRPFADGAFRLVARLDAPVVPVTVRYTDRRAYWIEELAIAAHLRERVLGAPLAVAVHVGTPLRAADFADAAAFTAATYGAVCEPIERMGELSTSIAH